MKTEYNARPIYAMIFSQLEIALQEKSWTKIENLKNQIHRIKDL